ncbi:MAG: adenylyltransferase/cytidyltransferase family protein [Actinomycetota bacterium]
MPQFGSVHGRFQGLHLGHEEYLIAAKRRCDYLYVGIAMHDPVNLSGVVVSDHRHELASNPFTYWERAQMVRAALLGAGYSADEFETHPFPIDDPSRLANYLPVDGGIKVYTTVYDSWGRFKVARLVECGYEVEVLWEREATEKLTTGTELRRRMAAGVDFTDLVSSSVGSFISDWSLVDRLRERMAAVGRPDFETAGFSELDSLER